MDQYNVSVRDDWRKQGQEKFLAGLELYLRNYTPYREGWEHDHCEFCGNKFSLDLDDLQVGYSTQDGYHWICVPCFEDFKNEFNWVVS